jgi:diguanylate cyclase (GGDEF)-like protein
MQWADCFRRELTSCAASRPYQVPVTMSVGISEHAMNQASAEALQASADAQLYQAKRAGRNRIQSESRLIV